MSGHPVESLVAKLIGVRQSGREYSARCPAHDDKRNSLSIGEGDDGRALLTCFAGCSPEAIVAALGLQMRDLFAQPASRNGSPAGGGGATRSRTSAQAHNLPTEELTDLNSCTLARYATAKGLPFDFLRGLGLSDVYYEGCPAVRISYLGLDGTEIAVRFRTALAKGEGTDNRFKWRSGSKAQPYGLWQLEKARAAGQLTLCEGESDCHTLWFHQEPALGIPGAALWREEWASYLDGIPLVYVVVEPDQGGQNFKASLLKSGIRSRVRFVDLGTLKDPSALHSADLVGFGSAWRAALTAAVPATEIAQAEKQASAVAAWNLCRDLAEQPDILAVLAADLERRGVVGETKAAKLLYLAVTSRLLKRPVSVVVKGPSSAGKSFLVEQVLSYFPPAAYYALSAMSDRVLAYSEEPLSHRHLVLYEAAGASSEMATYLLRSLLSEGRIRYETVEKTPDGLRSRFMEREGPTGLIVTTTAARLHSENETRLLSITLTDTEEQTRLIMEALAAPTPVGSTFDDGPRWHALQEWLAGGEGCEVVIPFAPVLAKVASAGAVRIRRDFSLLLTLIRAHAILHQAARERDEHGAIIATIADYGAVYELARDWLAEGVEATVPSSIKETVAAVAEICLESDTASLPQLAKKLRIDRSSASRRAGVCIDRGYLQTAEKGRGRPLKLSLGDPLPDEREVLPTPEGLAAAVALCGCVPVQPGIVAPPLSISEGVRHQASEEALTAAEGDRPTMLHPIFEQKDRLALAWAIMHDEE